MNLTTAEQTVMERFAYKTYIAGGAKAGYVLRRQAIAAAAGAESEVDGALATLVGRGLLTASEGGEFVYLTAAGVSTLAGEAAAVEEPAVEESTGAPA